MSDWRDTKRDVNRVGRLGLVWYIVIVLVVLALGAGIWALSVALSGPKGVGDAIIKKNSAENWTKAQAKFEEMYADIEQTDRKITVAATALAADPEDITLKQTYSGTVNYCLEVVGDYNAEARKYLSSEFRSIDLPQKIGITDPAIDCKE